MMVEFGLLKLEIVGRDEAGTKVDLEKNPRKLKAGQIHNLENVLTGGQLKKS